MPPVPHTTQSPLWSCESLETPTNPSIEATAESTSQTRNRGRSHKYQSKLRTSIDPSQGGEDVVISAQGDEIASGESSQEKRTLQVLRKDIFKRQVKYVSIPYRSPTPSEFGEEFTRGSCQVSELPTEVYKFLDERGLDAFAVPTDGNCLYHAITHGPAGSKHDIARKGTAGYITALREDNNVLDYLDDEQLDEMRTGTDAYFNTNLSRYILGKCRHRASAGKGASRSFENKSRAL